ncbi:MAG: hypothetical protein ACLRKY_10765 [Enterococcus gallinarum]|uniref:hypothetical protein n=1 Tax=Enterococcus gallinarum TaxID=1353 RepID=UPI00189B36E7|nr:hypothetical protein [Enterococcus gallinarum]
MTTKKGEFIENIVQGTINKKYIWKAFQSPLMEMRENIDSILLSRVQYRSSYYFENSHNVVALLNIPPLDYYIFIFSNRTGKSTMLNIDTQTYFRIRTIIENQMNVAEDLLDDFLNL